MSMAQRRLPALTPSSMFKVHGPFSSPGFAPFGTFAGKVQPTSHPPTALVSRACSTTIADITSSDGRAIIDALSLEPQTSVSLQALMRTGRGEYLHKTFKSDEVDRHAATELVLMQVAGFLRRELPIRMAHRVADLEGVPVLKDMKSVQSVKEAYQLSILEIQAFDDKIDTIEKEEEFAKIIENIYERHASVLVQSKFLEWLVGGRPVLRLCVLAVWVVCGWIDFALFFVQVHNVVVLKQLRMLLFLNNFIC